MLRRILAALAAAALLLLVAPVGAATAAVIDPAPAAAPAVVFTLDPLTVVHLVAAFVLPVVVGLVTTRVTSSAVRAWLLAGLTLLTSLLVELGRALEAGTTYDLGVALLAALPAFVISVSTYYGLWRPTGTTAAAQRVGARHLAE